VPGIIRLEIKRDGRFLLFGFFWRRPIRREGRNPGRGPNGLSASCRDLQTRTKNQILLAFLNSFPQP
jgi:hypothetical protein